MRKSDLKVIKNADGKFVLIPINDIEGARRTENSGNSMSCYQLGKTLVSTTVTAIQWTAWWAGALATNVSMCAVSGAAFGALGGYGHARWNEPCIEEKNSVAVSKCAFGSPDTVMGTLYGASVTALIGAAVTGVGFFKNPTIKGAQATVGYTAVGAIHCCAAMGKAFD